MLTFACDTRHSSQQHIYKDFFYYLLTYHLIIHQIDTHTMASSSNKMPGSTPLPVVILNKHSTSRPWTGHTFKGIIHLAKDHAKQLMKVKIDIIKTVTPKYLLQLKADVRTTYTVELASMNHKHGLPRMGFISANHQQAMKNRLTELHPWLGFFEDDFGAYCLLGIHVNSRQSDEKTKKTEKRHSTKTVSKKKSVRKSSKASGASSQAILLSSQASSSSPASTSSDSPGSPGSQSSSLNSQPGSPLGSQPGSSGSQPGSPGSQLSSPGSQPGSPALSVIHTPGFESEPGSPVLPVAQTTGSTSESESSSPVLSASPAATLTAPVLSTSNTVFSKQVCVKCKLSKRTKDFISAKTHKPIKTCRKCLSGTQASTGKRTAKEALDDKTSLDSQKSKVRKLSAKEADNRSTAEIVRNKKKEDLARKNHRKKNKAEIARRKKDASKALG